MRSFIYISTLVLLSLHAAGQGRFHNLFPRSAITAQYAGSTGLVTAGFSKVTARDKFEIGLLYGFLPKAFGGTNHSLALKGTYNPFRISLSDKLQLEPIQGGLFINQVFGKNLGLLWDEKYPRGYYWWSRSTRFHCFLSSQLSYMIGTKHVDRLSYFFEVNTNDLYVFSYAPNHRALSLYDILFFGTGLKLYIK